MKIDSPKLASAPRTSERPQLSTTTAPATPKSGNTGIVPTAAQPKTADTFEKTGTGSTSANTGIVPTNVQKTGTISTYPLPANLEPHRAEIDKYGEHIAKMPAQVQGKQIDLATDKLFKDLGDIATREQLGKAVTDSVAYFSSRGTGANDPQCLRAVVNDPVGTVRGGVGSAQDTARDYGRAITRDPTSLDPRNILRSVKRQPAQQQHTDETRQLFRRMPRWF